MADYVLPPLKPRPSYHWLEANLLKWREGVERNRIASKSIFGRFGYGITHCFLNRELRSGRKTPWLLRLWYLIGGTILHAFPQDKRQVGMARILSRAIERNDPATKAFAGSYVATNFVTGLMVLFVGLMALPYVIESAYIITTYRHLKYQNVTITSHYRDFDIGAHIFAVHGLINDQPNDELYILIGPSFWFQEYNPENIFGKISDGAVCDFSAYGTLIRMPLGLRYLSGGSLYALNPWAVNATCHMPNQK